MRKTMNASEEAAKSSIFKKGVQPTAFEKTAKIRKKRRKEKKAGKKKQKKRK